MTPDPFDLDAVPRDGYKRPLIVPPEGGDPIPYTRASAFASYLDDGTALATWKARQVALGVGRHEDLAAMAAGMEYGRDVDEVVEAALERVGANVKRNHGTAVHRFTEPGREAHAPARLRPVVDAWHAALEAHRLEVVDTERFTVCDALRVAGTFDHLVRHPVHGLVVLDKKTGSLHPHAVAVQLAVYARGAAYSVDDQVVLREVLDANPHVGIVAHIPYGSPDVCDLHLVDLDAGWQAAKAAAWVRDWRSRRDLITPMTPPGVDTTRRDTA